MGRGAWGVGAALAAAIVLSACAVDTYDVAYDDLHQARAHEAVERGWVPDWLPEGAVELHQRHTSEGAILTAVLPAADELPDTCRTATAVTAPPLSADWLPDGAEALGTSVTCEDWDGVVDGRDIHLWQ